MNFKKAFTLIEMIIVVLLIGVGLMAVISVLNYSYSFLFNISHRVTAINLAREGMEGVFSIRNTNWVRWSGKKDKCWLKINPLVDNNNNGCEDDSWFGTGSYILILTGQKQKYFALKKEAVPFSTGHKILSTDWNYLLCKKNNLIQACPSSGKPANYFSSALYFRQVRGGYLMDKYKDKLVVGCNNGNSSISYADGTLGNGNCGDGRSLEKNFCVDVVYFDGRKSKITFCSVLTNFRK